MSPLWTRRELAACCAFSFCVPALSVAAQLALPTFTPLEPGLDLVGQLVGISVLMGCCGVIAVLTPGWFHRRVVHVVLAVVFLDLFAAAFVPAGHIVHYFGRSYPLRDDLLAAADAAIGFHWPSMLAWFNGHPRFAALGAGAYKAFPWETVLLPVAIACAGRFVELHRFFIAYGLCMALGHAVVFFLPALGTYGFYGISSSMHDQLTLGYESRQVGEVLGMRDGSIVNLMNRPQYGIVTFPSFHAGLGILAGWAFWNLGPLRYPGLMLNAALIGATPLQGSHYLSDVIAGSALMALSIVASRHLVALALWIGSTRAGLSHRATPRHAAMPVGLDTSGAFRNGTNWSDGLRATLGPEQAHPLANENSGAPERAPRTAQAV
jgi:PAP2 superfamily